MIKEVDLAEAQLLGYAHGKRGYSLKSLIENMGLTKGEWVKIKKEYPKNLNDEEINEIDEYFLKH